MATTPVCPRRVGTTWLWPDGTCLPVVSGGATSDDDSDATDDTPAKDDDAADSAESLGDAGRQALSRERKARRDAERQLKAIQAQLKDLQDKDKSETEKLREENETLKADLVKATNRGDRLQVALDKGLTAAQAKRLAGDTLEELEADADEVLEAFPSRPEGATPPPSRKPAADLKGGSDPTQEPDVIDPAELAKAVPRP